MLSSSSIFNSAPHPLSHFCLRLSPFSSFTLYLSHSPAFSYTPLFSTFHPISQHTPRFFFFLFPSLLAACTPFHPCSSSFFLPFYPLVLSCYLASPFAPSSLTVEGSVGSLTGRSWDQGQIEMGCWSAVMTHGLRGHSGRVCWEFSVSAITQRQIDGWAGICCVKGRERQSIPLGTHRRENLWWISTGIASEIIFCSTGRMCMDNSMQAHSLDVNKKGWEMFEIKRSLQFSLTGNKQPLSPFTYLNRSEKTMQGISHTGAWNRSQTNKGSSKIKMKY